MHPVWHAALSTAAGLIYRRRRGRFPWLWWVAGTLVDLDHYAWYVFRTRRWHPAEAWILSRVALLRRHRDMPLHRWPVIGSVWLIGRLWPPLAEIAWGMVFHRLLDTFSRHWPRVRSWRRRRRYYRLWAVVAERAGYRCERCGATGVVLELHHRIPEAQGGRTHPANLMVLCRPCHDRAHGRPPRPR